MWKFFTEGWMIMNQRCTGWNWNCKKPKNQNSWKRVPFQTSHWIQHQYQYLCLGLKKNHTVSVKIQSMTISIMKFWKIIANWTTTQTRKKFKATHNNYVKFIFFIHMQNPMMCNRLRCFIAFTAITKHQRRATVTSIKQCIANLNQHQLVIWNAPYAKNHSCTMHSVAIYDILLPANTRRKMNTQTTRQANIKCFWNSWRKIKISNENHITFKNLHWFV